MHGALTVLAVLLDFLTQRLVKIGRRPIVNDSRARFGSPAVLV